MAKSVYFKVRSKKKSKQKRKPGKIILVLIAVAVLVAGVYRMIPPAAVPAMASSAGQYSRTDPSTNIILYRSIIAQVIPGLREAVPETVTTEAGEAPDYGFRLAGFSDIRDPKNILAAQIPYMVEAGIDLEPLVTQPVTGETPPEEPRIVIPLNRTLNGEGKVVIYHTHTTESFEPTSGKWFTDNLEMTVAHLGEQLASLLVTNYGIPVVHDKTIHDIPRTPAYQEALPTITRLLSQNPQTKLVIDLHRDGMDRNVTTANINGQPTGRLMFMVGNRNNPHAAQHKRIANFLHETLEELAPGLSRGVRERPLNYNQHVHPGALLIEVGGHKNSLEEAMRSIPYLAEALAQLYESGL